MEYSSFHYINLRINISVDKALLFFERKGKEENGWSKRIILGFFTAGERFYSIQREVGNSLLGTFR